MVLTTPLNEAIAKTIVRNAEIPTADFVVIDSIKKLYDVGLKFPLYGGTGIGINSKSLVTNKDNLQRKCNKQLQKYKQPLQIEKYLGVFKGSDKVVTYRKGSCNNTLKQEL